ncbi:MAG TPA: DUF1559 domain-containing protein [Gemmataceae bacterium]|jgi:hypothetical protein
MSRDQSGDRPPRSRGIGATGLVLAMLALCGGLISVPAIVHSIRGLAQRDETRTYDMNNFRVVGLAVINQEVMTRRLSPAYALGPDGEPNRGLSWRVGLLPYIDDDALNRQFKLDEAWDSPANRPLSRTHLPVYGSAADPPDDQTRIRVFVGPGTPFEDSPEWRRKASVGRIRDGVSNTLLAVETAERVPWAAPQDVPYQPDGPLPALGHPSRNVVIVLMADGSVRPLKKPISPAVLHALITRDGGEQLPANWDQ